MGGRRTLGHSPHRHACQNWGKQGHSGDLTHRDHSARGAQLSSPPAPHCDRDHVPACASQGGTQRVRTVPLPCPSESGRPRARQAVCTLLRCWHWPRPRDSGHAGPSVQSGLEASPGPDCGQATEKATAPRRGAGTWPWPSPQGPRGAAGGIPGSGSVVPNPRAAGQAGAGSLGHAGLSASHALRPKPGRAWDLPPLCGGRVPSPSRPHQQPNPQPGRGQCFPATSLCGQFSKYPVRSPSRVTTGRLLGSGDVWPCPQRLGSVQYN